MLMDIYIKLYRKEYIRKAHDISNHRGTSLLQSGELVASTWVWVPGLAKTATPGTSNDNLQGFHWLFRPVLTSHHVSNQPQPSPHFRAIKYRIIHRHRFPAKHDFASRQYRASHCFNSEYTTDYYLHFPFVPNGHDAYYEIDKERALYVTVGHDPQAHFDVAVDDVSKRRKWTEASEPSGVEDDDQKWIVWVVSSLVLGEVGHVRNYLEKSAEKDILLHGVDAYTWEEETDESEDDEDGYANSGTQSKMQKRIHVETTGKTALILAAAEDCPAMVQLLLEFGADPNAAGIYGWTPLMEAAFWGRKRNVEILLENGAKTDLECTHKGRQKRVVDFADEQPDNAEDRAATRVYREDIIKRSRDRRYIAALLKERAKTQNQATGFTGSSTGVFTFDRSPTRGASISFFAHFELPKKYKTIGVWRGQRFPVKAAMSGWTSWVSGDITQEVPLIGGKDYTDAVAELCPVVGHRLEPSGWDQGRPGRFHACHAEKQLIAYFVSRHRFLPDELPGSEGLPDLSRLSLADDRSNTIGTNESRLKVAELAKAAPPVRLTKATIMVCRPVCPDCRLFVDRVNTFFGLEISVIECFGSL
ncbi:hypothetical protein RB595_010703 [Gaeumannomyces hyphopodioides]